MLNNIISIVKQAGKAILDIYNAGDFNIQIKSDRSPLTKADLIAHHLIIDFLQKQYPQVPCLSEESENIDYAERKKWTECFIIDPLDGTKEFIDRNNDFTVNIAFQQQGRVQLGVIYLPVTDVVYFAAEGLGAFKQEKNQAAKKIQVRKLTQKLGKNHLTVVASRRHGLDKVQTLCKNFESFDLINRGSSLKMCLVAEGAADLYPRLAFTSEWDTAAAQVIVEQAGGKIVQLDFSEMRYNQKKSLLNPFFLVLGDTSFDWKNQLFLSAFNFSKK